MRNFRGGFIEHSCPYIDNAKRYLQDMVKTIEGDCDPADLYYCIDCVDEELESTREINKSLRNLAEDYEDRIKELESQVRDIERKLDAALDDVRYYEKQLQEA